nr:alpha/beta hydrolase fold protein [Tanacetum cinerariifolium]
MNLVKKDGTTDLPPDNGILAMLMGCNKLERLDIRLFSHGGLTDVGWNISESLKHSYDINTGKSILFAPRLPAEHAAWIGEIKALSHFKREKPGDGSK